MFSNRLKIQQFLRCRPDMSCLRRYISKWLTPRNTLQREQYLVDLVLTYKADDADLFLHWGEISDLLESGVDPDAKGLLTRVEEWQSQGKLRLDEDDTYPMTPLMAAVVIDAPEIIELLMQYGAKATADNPFNCTPLHVAAKKMSPRCLETLIDCGADIEVTCKPPDYPTGTTALHVAAEFSYSCVEELLRRGANPGVRDGRGQTPLYVACAIGHSQSVASLLESDPRGEITNITDDENETPLHSALRRGDVMRKSVTQMMEDKGADVTVRNVNSQPHVLAAMEHGWMFAGLDPLLLKGEGCVFGQEHRMIDFNPDVPLRICKPRVRPRRRYGHRIMWYQGHRNRHWGVT